MVQVDKQEVRGGEFIKISTDNHWTDIINIHEYEDFGDRKKLSLSYSSGGANEVTPVELAKSMVEAWSETLKILEEKSLTI